MRFKEIVAPLALTAMLSGTPAAGALPAEVSQRVGTETSGPQPVGRESKMEKKLGKMWLDGIHQVREEFATTGKLKVLKGFCIGWQSQLGSYTVTANPAIYVRQTQKEYFSFYVFSGGFVDDNPATPVLMNGSFTYAKVDSQGKPIRKSILSQRSQVIILDDKLPQNHSAEVIDVVGQLVNGKPALFDRATGEKIVATKTFFLQKGETRTLREMCEEALV